MWSSFDWERSVAGLRYVIVRLPRLLCPRQAKAINSKELALLYSTLYDPLCLACGQFPLSKFCALKVYFYFKLFLSIAC
jgi:hypothetical protein